MESWHKYSIFTLIVYLCKMNRKSVILCILVVFVLSGCSRYREVSLENISISQFNMTSLSTARMKIKATLNNPTGGRLQLTGMNGTLNMKDKKLAEFNLDSTLVFAPRSMSTNEGVMSLKISDMSVLFSGFTDLDESLLDEIKLSFDATFKTGGIKRKLRFNNIPAKKLLEL